MYLAWTILPITAIACYLQGVAVAKLLLRYQIVDLPNDRSSHTRPTARGGGIAIIIAIMLIALWLLTWSDRQPLLAVALCAAVLAGVSFMDDLKSLGFALRLGCHFLAAIAALVSLKLFQFSTDISSLLPMLGSSSIALFWIIGYTNAFNFMDGINGIAAGQAAITSIGMAILTSVATGQSTLPPVLLSLAVGGAAIGFLPYNFPRARMFMGDVGSAPLGFLLGFLVLWSAKIAGLWLLVPLALLHANFVFDTAITLVRRVARGDKWHQAHREHFYQRLVRSGKSHTFVTTWEMALQLVVLGLMLLYLQASPPARIVLALAVTAIWLTFFAYCELSFRRHLARPVSGALQPEPAAK